ncbi:unnamed protein product [Chrysodeixis includens]|uniref:Uncharacterized protein n=1 Tax=Chrysodeixis includens TaxID=689277 RepID=A0A9P0C5T8_CHRIL|nr:unnamed protein product [Chrysodeixis includens]
MMCRNAHNERLEVRFVTRLQQLDPQSPVGFHAHVFHELLNLRGVMQSGHVQQRCRYSWTQRYVESLQRSTALVPTRRLLLLPLLDLDETIAVARVLLWTLSFQNLFWF